MSPEEVEEQVGIAVRNLFAQMGIRASASEISEFFLLNQSLPPKEQLSKAVEISMRFAVGAGARQHSKSVKTRSELDRVLRDINEAARTGPTLFRQAVKESVRNVRRPPGPGRNRKFSDEDCGILCDEITLQMRSSPNVTKAIEKVAANCIELIGKTISVRKLKDIWKNKNDFPSRLS